MDDILNEKNQNINEEENSELQGTDTFESESKSNSESDEEVLQEETTILKEDNADYSEYEDKDNSNYAESDPDYDNSNGTLEVIDKTQAGDDINLGEMELDEGDEPVTLETDTSEIEDELNETSEAIDWESIEFEDENKIIPTINADDIKRLVNSGLFGDAIDTKSINETTKIVEDMVNTSRNLLRIKYTNDKVQDTEFGEVYNEEKNELGLTQDQEYARNSLAQLQVISRSSLREIQTKENILLTLNMQNVRELLSLAVEKYYKNDTELSNERVVEICKKGFFTNFYRSYIDKDVNLLKIELKRILNKIYEMDYIYDKAYTISGVLKKFIDGKIRFSFIHAFSKVDEIADKFSYFRTLMFNLALKFEPEINEEESRDLLDPNSRLSLALKEVESTGMFKLDDIPNGPRLAKAAKKYYEVRDKFIELFTSSAESKEKIIAYIEDIYNSWVYKHKYYFKRTKHTVEDLLILFGGYTPEEQLKIMNGENVPKRIPQIDDAKTYKNYKQQSLMLEGTMYVESAKKNNWNVDSLRLLYDFFILYLQMAFFTDKLYDFINYDPYDNILDSDRVFGELFKDGWTEERAKEWGFFKENIRNDLGKKTSTMNPYTRSCVKNTALNNMEIALKIMETPLRPDLRKLDIVKENMGEFFIESSLINWVFVLMEKEEAFDEMIYAVADFVEASAIAFEEHIINNLDDISPKSYSKEEKEIINNIMNNKRLTKKQRSRMKKKNKKRNKK